MVVRNFREHVTRRDWVAVAIDILTVFLGVFLGIQANNWNEERLADRETRTYLSRLTDDLRTNELDLSGRLVYYKAVRQHAIEALQGFSSPDAKLDETFLVDAYQASQIRQRPMRRFTYDELVSSGGLARIGDQDLREQLDLHYLGLRAIDENIREIPPYRERIRREMPYQVQERLRSRCDERVREINGAVIRTLPSSCSTGLDRAQISGAVARLRATPEMDRDLTRYLTDIDQKLNAYRLAHRRSRELRQNLQRALR